MIPTHIIRKETLGVTIEAIFSCCGPVHTACGIISPKNRTHVTEIMIAQTEGTIASRNIGKASIANALHNNKVTSK